jgi:hypothetical protein
VEIRIQIRSGIAQQVNSFYTPAADWSSSIL